SNAKNVGRVVVLGAGWGGLSAAKTIKQISPNVEVVIIDKKREFISCPMSNWVIGQLKSMEDITFSFDNLKSKYSINFIHEEAINIDPSKKIIKTDKQEISYDKLILSPGIELNYSSIENWNKSSFNNFPSAWKAGSETKLLSDKVKNLSNGGVVAISIPLGPYRCPPGPYERASLIASYLKKYKKNTKLIILDSNQKIVSKGVLFKEAWDEFYSDIIEYRPNSGVIGVDNINNKFITDFEDLRCDVANLIPSQRAPKFLKENGLIEKGSNWAAVNPYDFSSSIAKDIFIIGDSTSQSNVGRVPKSGYIANSMGKVCALAVIAELYDLEKASPSLINTCYSLVSSQEGISVSAIYNYDEKNNKIKSIKGASGLSPHRSPIIKTNAWDWASNIWKDMLG
ncbi:MAG: FCSD flavin-binding domain-containing protein, partial [Candidatus Puniceispirillales bacterium]